MTTKEKLDLLWKYLLLIVLVYGFAQMGRSHSPKFLGMRHAMPEHGMMWKSGHDYMTGVPGMKDVQVRIEKSDDGDSTMVVTVNGEVIDIDAVNWKDIHGLEDIDIEVGDLDDMGAHVFVKKFKKDGKPGEKRIKIMKKKIEDDK
jgi:hypothetical protein